MVVIVVLHMHPLYHIHVISCCLQLAFLLLWVVWMWNSSMYHCTGNAGGDWYNTMDCGGSFSSSTLIWCTLPCLFLTALCCETQVIRLSDLWGSCKYMYNQCFIRTVEGKSEGFIPQTRKPREKYLHKDMISTLHTKELNSCVVRLALLFFSFCRIRKSYFTHISHMKGDSTSTME